MSLQKAVEAAIRELTAKSSCPPERYVYAPHVRSIGESLKKALGEDAGFPALRPDVLLFGLKMSAMMNDKETVKGNTLAAPISEPLMKLDLQCGKLKEFGVFERPEDLRRILIHIANFAMIAESKLGK